MESICIHLLCLLQFLLLMPGSLFFFPILINYVKQSHFVILHPLFLLAGVAVLCHHASNNTQVDGCYGYCYLEEGSCW